MPVAAHFSPEVLPLGVWRERAEAHYERISRWTLPHRERRSRREPHPVYDFLFQYYSYPPGRLESWHPDLGEAPADCGESRGTFEPPLYQSVGGALVRDPASRTDADLQRQRDAMHVLQGTRGRPANFGCFGIHEWAMAYRGHDVRHVQVAPLRMGQTEVDAFVRSRPIACSHFEAFRFFSPEAKPLNRVPLEWATRHDMEQPGCVHANMDLYRWAYESMPWIGSDLLGDTFELAIDLRVLDMQASPYDLIDFGFEPVRVETEEGRTEYRERQAALAETAGLLRDRLIDALEAIEA